MNEEREALIRYRLEMAKTTLKDALILPDFIFWLQEGERYFIVFVDPKGTEHRDPDRKIEGYLRGHLSPY